MNVGIEMGINYQDILFQQQCPFYYKDQLVEWASSYFREKPTKYKRMKKQQLYAIWYKEAQPLEIIKW